ncbi:BING4CT-domain-containing protein [Jaminaea rosea]|uniref:U three protein 7 n=1 Tax=Jaminaea rosea TaxID=1569628 RepID=A0A316UPQ7_9BASI|nr:BING4CT-domain-containing protein [Jaminaea rosea]PWN27279.1 BING4CT-domain-containing protein [Jaminaea rosea]
MARGKSSGSGGSGSGGGGDNHSPRNAQMESIRSHTRLPTSLQQSAPLQGVRPPKSLSLSSIPDKKLRSNLSRDALSTLRARSHATQADTYLYQGPVGEEAGQLEAEGEMERTARLTQGEIKDAVGLEAASKSFSLDLSGGRGGVGLGPYRSAYSPNGRQLLLAGRAGHLASFDWQAGKLNCEIQVKETVRDATWLHNSSFFAAAQKKHVFIYDSAGAEVHRLKEHVDVHRLEFLRYHFLLCSVGGGGWLKYHDTSTGQMVAQHRTKLGACDTLAQNPLTAVLHLGHGNGTVTLWTPNLPQPALSLLAHRGPVSGVSVSPRDGGREMATSGMEGGIKVWDCRLLGRGPVREWVSRKPANEVQYSQRGLLATAWGTHVSIYDTKAPLSSRAPPGPYMTNNFPQSSPVSLAFCPFEDVLGVGHSRGFDSLLVPGAGEPRFDSMELDPFEGRTARREREVRGLLDKIRPDMISVDPSFLGQVREDATKGGAPREEAGPSGLARAQDGTPYARLGRLERLRLEGKAANDGSDSDEEDNHDEDSNAANVAIPSSGPPPPQKERKKARGKNTSMKRYLRKKRGNVVDQASMQVQAKLQRAREEHEERRERKERMARGEGEEQREPSALDVFAVQKKGRRRR